MTTHAHTRTTPSARRHRIYGYPRSDKWYYKYAKKHGVGLDEDGKPHWDIVGLAALHIIERVGFRVHPIGVFIKGDPYLCLAIASNDSRDHLPMPPKEHAEEIIKALQEVLGTDRRPRLCDYNRYV
ncbi:hypothetical protein BOTBODRAFT_174476 [Botryobasidium botryosum FD-172 SS1]|uniref:Uncharacterized protein n=1 Tax=Botryobasidium botryosum (strain FD-172 SS1) TaxID=930990 RepID=A0A067MJS3_BOTB1|nr:hypothetical protein BOTBODRAFT_174476 [Botryobasidium botryosum FD-172 SS1]